MVWMIDTHWLLRYDKRLTKRSIIYIQLNILMDFMEKCQRRGIRNMK